MINILEIILLFAMALAFPIYLVAREIKKRKTLDNTVSEPYRDLKPEETTWLQSRKPIFSHNYKGDLPEKVRKIEGPFFKEAVKSGASWTYIITIGKVEFNLQKTDNVEYEKIIQDIPQGEKISIQYSPFSKRIWSINKLN